MSERDKKIRLKFTDLKSIKLSLNRVANLVANGELDPQRGSCIATLCNTLLKASKQEEIEKQIEELQEIIEDIRREKDK
mgnify:FL=1|jgi:hypothetical protein